MENYERIIEKVSKISGIGKEEIERRVEAKRAKLSGLISKEGATQIVAAEMGISFDNEKLKIEELLPGMRKVNVIGEIINVFPPRSFKTKKGDEGKVANLFIADETSNIKVVLWDTNAIALIERGEIVKGSVVEIANGSMRDNEIHLGSFSEIKIVSQTITEAKTGKIFREKTLAELKNSDSIRIRAFIVQTFEPRFFYVCPECKKKAVQEGGDFVCAEHGKVVADKRALMSLVIDDGTETMRVVVFQDNLSSIGLTDLGNLELTSTQRENLLGKEMFFSGTARNNKLFNNIEMIIEGAEEINVDALVAEMEK